VEVRLTDADSDVEEDGEDEYDLSKGSVSAAIDQGVREGTDFEDDFGKGPDNLNAGISKMLDGPGRGVPSTRQTKEATPIPMQQATDKPYDYTTKSPPSVSPNMYQERRETY
jgi:hypothetical protein